MHIINTQYQAFTLVELIVVITILSVLSTIGFISFQGYGVISRDAVRISDMRSIEKGFSVKLSKAERLPIPDYKIDITASGTLLTYQGYAGTGTLGTIGVHGGGKDPLDDIFYTYSTNPARNKYQLLGFFENQGNISLLNNITYADISERYPVVKGDDLVIVLDPVTNIPSQDNQNNVDVVHTTQEYKFIIHNNSSEGNFIGSGSTIIDKRSDGLDVYSCKQILEHFSPDFLENKDYTIISNTGEEITVFCDMKNGGYTGLFSVNPGGTTWKFNSIEWTNPSIKENDFLTQETTYRSYENFNTNYIKICRGNLNNCYIMNHGLNIPLHKFYSEDITYIDFSRHIYIENLPDTHYVNRNPPDTIGIDNHELFLSQLLINDPEDNNYRFNKLRFNKYGLGINIYNTNKLGFQGDNSWPSSNNYGLGIGVFMPYHESSTPCIPGNPIDSNRALSVLISGVPCFYDSPDDIMWYVLGR